MCMRADRRSAIAQWSLDVDEALIQEGAGGYDVATTEAVTGAARFSSGAGRHGSFDD
jgi:enoyl-CoA hydratase